MNAIIEIVNKNRNRDEQLPQHIIDQAHYLLEKTLLYTGTVEFKPSSLAFAALSIALHTNGLSNWPGKAVLLK